MKEKKSLFLSHVIQEKETYHGFCARGNDLLNCPGRNDGNEGQGDGSTRTGRRLARYPLLQNLKIQFYKSAWNIKNQFVHHTRLKTTCTDTKNNCRKK